MNLSLNRRRFIQATSSAVATAALLTRSGAARAQSGEVRVVVVGGDVAKAHAEAIIKPFEAETGIKVTPINQDVSAAQIGMMVAANSVSVDVGILSQTGVLDLARHNYLEKIDYSTYKQNELDAMEEYAKKPFGVAPYMYSWVMAFNTDKFPAGKPQPATWADFWDVVKFPGARTLPTGQDGGGPWEEALLADGVPVDKLYPMDIDRVFASLDKIKPHVRKWWNSGSEVFQIMRDNVADLAHSYDGRMVSLVVEGKPIEVNRNRQKLTLDYYYIPKGSPNAQNAQRYIEFATRADRQAALARLFPVGPSNRNAYKQIPDDAARKLATYPEYMANSYAINAEWYAEIGQDGVSNTQRLVQRWNDWILR
ncbi:ABC transporter substrate-binding protein [Mesorhizobium escarrei]|uniref:Spermidine/putrescine ABC transporter substrate-binding protein n=1 Tax=Mesorhizobium escarrei TaxID=666018 RepID=A0ABM9E7I6_9HYPH|nr:ABC transporter substrate-binding protein [Mesorhizobium escarrei]CAH2405101.1 Spermidine/putrescine ABC transporter substrate-binding protein [Mesorhizobium escarrei]